MLQLLAQLTVLVIIYLGLSQAEQAQTQPSRKPLTTENMVGLMVTSPGQVHFTSGSMGEGASGELEVNFDQTSILGSLSTDGSVTIGGAATISGAVTAGSLETLSGANVDTLNAQLNPSCPSGLVQHTGYCIQPETIYPTGLPWGEAHDTCIADGLRLCSQSEIVVAMKAGKVTQYDYDIGNVWYVTSSQHEVTLGAENSNLCEVQGNFNEDGYDPYSVQCQHTYTDGATWRHTICCSGLLKDGCPRGTVEYGGNCIQPTPTTAQQTWWAALDHCRDAAGMRLCSAEETTSALYAGALRNYPYATLDVWYVTTQQSESSLGMGDENTQCDVNGNFDQASHESYSVQCSHAKSTTSAWRRTPCCSGTSKCPTGTVDMGGYCIQPSPTIPFGTDWLSAMDQCDAMDLRMCSESEITTALHANVLKAYWWSEQDAWYQHATQTENTGGATGPSQGCDLQGNYDQPSHPWLSVQCHHEHSWTHNWRGTVCCY